MSDDVSRETPPAPELVQGVFGVDGAVRAERLHALLSDEGVKRGLIGPRETARLWDRHLLNCGVIGEAIKGERTVADVGSGAGLPGLPLAIARPDLSITLIEPLQRRVDFLDEAVERLELPNVQVVRARAEELVGDRAFAVVTSRAVAPLDRLMRWCLPLVDIGGEMLAMKGARAAEEIEASESVWRRLAGARPEVLVAGSALLEQPTTLVRARPASRRRRQM